MTLGLTDRGDPSRSAPDLPVTVNIFRNAHPPLFFDQVYYATVDEDENAGFLVKTVSARDADTRV